MIRKLPQNIINILAAGEVVERPYSVVKELVENSLDAGAKNVKVEILNGWKQLIKVSDDGIWISKEDLPLTIEEFATSKISKVEDLYQLGSFYEGEGIFLYKPYKVGAYFLIDDKIFSWNTIVKFTFSDKNSKVCFKMNLASGRLNKVKCN